MAAEAVGEKESGHTRRLAQNRVVIGSHLVEARPGSFRIHCKILEHWHTVGGTNKNFLHKCRIELGVVAGLFFEIVPRQKEAAATKAAVPA